MPDDAVGPMPREAMFYKKGPGKRVECGLCAHLCDIPDKGSGFCGARTNAGGRLYTMTYGRLIASSIEPIEKRLMYHYMPGSKSLSVAAPGCNFRCAYCENWMYSQYFTKGNSGFDGRLQTPDEIVRVAKAGGCGSVSYAHTEPTIFLEYALDISKAARSAGLSNVFATNGYMTAGALDAIAPFLDAANVDLKSFDDGYYNKVCGGSLAPVLRTIKDMVRRGIWIEISTLIVPDLNDGPGELDEIAKFIAGLDRGIPWHIKRFYPEFKYKTQPPTPPSMLEMARDIGYKNGLSYVYIEDDGARQETYCPNCNALIALRDMKISYTEVYDGGRCPQCFERITGVWGKGPAGP